jgi:diguanylate cyclase (GGDEF)-like protein/PAS domain S-box-containing protein
MSLRSVLRWLACIATLLGLWGCACVACWAQEPLRFGMLAYRQKDLVATQWQPMAAYLTKAMGRPIEFTPYVYDELNDAIAKSQVDVVFTNPGHFILLQHRYGISAPLATQILQLGNNEVAAFGGAIIARSDASNINALADLSGKRIAVTDTFSLGGYQMQAFELLEAGVGLPQRTELKITGLPHDRVLEAVLDGKADVGFVRSGLIEALAREGKLDLNRVKVINRQNLPSFPFAVSTRLYPEWPLTVLPHVDEDTARQLTVALLSLGPDHIAARQAGLHGFTNTANYDGVDELLRRLRVPPYASAPELSVWDIWRKFKLWISATAVLFLLLLTSSAWLWRQSRSLRRSEMLLTRDIAERKQTETRLQLAASVFTHTQEAIIITNAANQIIEVNAAFTSITGYSREEALGQNPRILKSQRQDPEHYTTMWQTLKAQGFWVGEMWNRHKAGHDYACVQSISLVPDADGKPLHYVALLNDITAVKDHQRQLEQITHFDPLTALPNRSLLLDRLQQAIAHSQRQKHPLAVAYFDIDGFKSVNDSFGHAAGDELLKLVAHQVKLVLREGDTLARFGGDEFVMLLVDLESVQEVEVVLARVLRAVAHPVVLNATEVRVSASIGVTVYPQDNADADQLIRHADQAMVLAKLAGKNCYQLFDVSQDETQRTQRENVQHVLQAIERDEFVLYYQPKVNMRTGTVVGAEALIRWQHPERGLLAPGLFLPLIEGHPVCIALGEWVISTALAQMAQWRGQGLRLPVSVNISAMQLQAGDFVARLAELMAQFPQVPAQDLELEVLETSALEDIAQVSGVMAACQTLGVTFALDDFGTGYSSLTYLRRLPAELLKIDQSFVRDMLEDDADLAIVKGVIGLAAAFHRRVIAEGVETALHGERLLRLGCELAQGYGISRPLPARALPLWLDSWMPDPAWSH